MGLEWSIFFFYTYFGQGARDFFKDPGQGVAGDNAYPEDIEGITPAEFSAPGQFQIKRTGIKFRLAQAFFNFGVFFFGNFTDEL